MSAPAPTPLHGPELCYWMREKDHVLHSIELLDQRVGRFEERIADKLDSLTEKVTRAIEDASEVPGLRDKLGESREEIAVLKVKASLIGLGTAAGVELLVFLVKNLTGK